MCRDKFGCQCKGNMHSYFDFDPAVNETSICCQRWRYPTLWPCLAAVLTLTALVFRSGRSAVVLSRGWPVQNVQGWPRQRLLLAFSIGGSKYSASGPVAGVDGRLTTVFRLEVEKTVRALDPAESGAAQQAGLEAHWTSVSACLNHLGCVYWAGTHGKTQQVSRSEVPDGTLANDSGIRVY